MASRVDFFIASSRSSSSPGVIQNSAFSAKGCFNSLPGILSLPALSKVNFSVARAEASSAVNATSPSPCAKWLSPV
ncbi:hypothetical protein D3C78_1016190 [compost metagenome]